MDLHRGASLPGMPPARQREVIPSSVMGMLIFVFVEAMMFAGLISAFTIVRTSALGEWPPPGQVRLPVETTAFNTMILLLSGVALYAAHRVFAREGEPMKWLTAAIGLGAFFVAFQGWEWASLLREGLTLTSSNHGSFFYFIVGAHALHAIGALGVLGWVWYRNRQGVMLPTQLWAAEVFWYFVVGLWPILYWRVYL